MNDFQEKKLKLANLVLKQNQNFNRKKIIKFNKDNTNQNCTHKFWEGIYLQVNNFNKNSSIEHFILKVPNFLRKIHIIQFNSVTLVSSQKSTHAQLKLYAQVNNAQR